MRKLWLFVLVVVLAGPVSGQEKKQPYEPNTAVHFTDAAGASWDLQMSGRVNYGAERRTFGTAFRLYVSGRDFYSYVQQAHYRSRRTGKSLHHKLGNTGVEIGPIDIGNGILVTRRIERTRSGWMRFTTLVHNSGGSDRSVSLYTDHGFNSQINDPREHQRKSSLGRGEQAWCVPQRYNRRSLLLVVSSDKKKVPVSLIRRSSSYARVNWPTLSVPAGKRAALVHFALQIRGHAEAPDWVKKFRRSHALRGLPAEIRKALINFKTGGGLAGLEIEQDPGADLVVLDDERSLRGKVTLGKLTLQTAHRKIEVAQAALWGIGPSQLPGHFRVGFANGQILVARIQSGPVSLALLGGQTLKIPWSRLRSLAFQGAQVTPPPAGAKVVQLTGGDRLIVTGLGKPLAVRTRLGKLELSLEEVGRLLTLEEENWGHRIWLAGGSRLGCLVVDQALELTLVSGEKLKASLEGVLSILPVTEREELLLDPGDFRVGLRNGDLLVGRIPAKQVVLHSEFGKLTIGWRQVKRMTLEGVQREASVVLFDGNLVRGQLGTPAVELTVGKHPMRVPLVLLERLEQPKQGLPAELRKQVVRMVKDLDAPAFKVREKAQQGLIALGPAVKPYLEKLLASGEMSAEQKQRIKQVLRAVKK